MTWFAPPSRVKRIMALRREERLTGLEFECEHCGFRSRHYATVADCEAQGITVHFLVGDTVQFRRIHDGQSVWDHGVIIDVHIAQKTHVISYEIVCDTMDDHPLVDQSDVKSTYAL